MAQNKKPELEKETSKASARKKYEKPSIKTENLTAVAALCNGTSTGGRKAVGPCTKLKS
ncbi:MAG: hypothetical protein AABZ55_01500 [Bdellovibrionota bacterium]